MAFSIIMTRSNPLQNSSTPIRFWVWLGMMLFCITAAFSQNDNTSGTDFDDNPNLHLGVKAGINFSNLKSTELTNKSTYIGMDVGLYANYKLNKVLALQIDFIGNVKGANFNYGTASSLNKLALFYLDVPITMQFSFVKKAKLIPYVGIMPSVIFRKDAYKTQEAVPQPISIGIKKYDFGVSAGILYKMDPRVGLQLQFNYGLIDVNNPAPNQLVLPFYPYLGGGGSIYNRNLQLSLVF